MEMYSDLFPQSRAIWNEDPSYEFEVSKCTQFADTEIRAS